MAQIIISIEFNNQQLDYQIPTGITVSRMSELMHCSFADMHLPKKWTLKLKGKHIQVNDTDLVADLPIGNGDIFSIVSLEE